jgi:excisionase family DNA binding protein
MFRRAPCAVALYETPAQYLFLQWYIYSVADDRVTLEEAARRLGVSRRRVQALVQAGDIRADRVGRQWLVPLSSVRSRERVAVRQPGRPLSAERAWLAILDSSLDVGSSDADLFRRRVRSRAEHHELWVHPGLLDEIRERRDIVLGGRDAADVAGLPVGGESFVDVYVAQESAATFIESLGARPADSDPNLFLHVVPTAQFDELHRAGPLPLIVAWLDLADRDDRAADLVADRLMRFPR